MHDGVIRHILHVAKVARGSIPANAGPYANGREIPRGPDEIVQIPTLCHQLAVFRTRLGHDGELSNIGRYSKEVSLWE